MRAEEDFLDKNSLSSIDDVQELDKNVADHRRLGFLADRNIAGNI